MLFGDAGRLGGWMLMLSRPSERMGFQMGVVLWLMMMKVIGCVMAGRPLSFRPPLWNLQLMSLGRHHFYYYCHPHHHLPRPAYLMAAPWELKGWAPPYHHWWNLRPLRQILLPSMQRRIANYYYYCGGWNLLYHRPMIFDSSCHQRRHFLQWPLYRRQHCKARLYHS